MKTKSINEIIEEDKVLKFANPYHYIGNPTTSKKPSTLKHKIKPQQNNDLCNCGSNLKYKKCCKLKLI